MGKKKFIDKKKAITFRLLARDSSVPYYDDSPGADRVFVRVDNSPLSDEYFFEGDDNSNGVSSSSFADAQEDDDGNQLPKTVRKEIRELGFPDDGYNYLFHLREIKSRVSGPTFFRNRKAKHRQLPRDVKGYDASRVEIHSEEDDADDKLIHNVASRTFNIRVQKAADPDVAALLDDSDVSELDSDNEDLEEDFVIQANRLEEGECFDVDNSMLELAQKPNSSQEDNAKSLNETRYRHVGEEDDLHRNMARNHRLLDEQFDMLELKEYGSDCDSYDGDYDGSRGDEGEEKYEELLAPKVVTTPRAC